jgi:hypothetical protein
MVCFPSSFDRPVHLLRETFDPCNGHLVVGHAHGGCRHTVDVGSLVEIEANYPL